MKKKAIILAIAGVLATPSAFAAEDDMGMHFTSASEGFYGSIRAGFFDNVVDDYGSRLGVNGFNDLGNGLEGYYSFEYRTDKGNTAVRNNKSLVGLRGDFGQFKIGRGFDAAPYELVYGSTDIANWASGAAKGGLGSFFSDNEELQDALATSLGVSDDAADVFVSHLKGLDLDGASNVYYRTPNMNGFEAGMGFEVDGSDADNEDLDNWNIAAKYSMNGFTAGAAYTSFPDHFANLDTVEENATTGVVSYETDDLTAWGISLGYGQDNWSLNGWYGEQNTGDMGEGISDLDAFSLSGSIAVAQVNLYAVYESVDLNPIKDNYTTLGVQYNLGTKARVWLEYINQERDSNPGADDYVAIGLRHDF